MLLKKFEIIFASSRFSPARTEAVEKFSEFKKEMTSKFESVATSYNSFSNKITKDITDSFTRYEENVKNFNEKVQKMEQSQENLTKIFSNAVHP